MQRIRAIVHGVVQGVGFRFSTREQAQRLGVKGYVRNCPNGTVEIVVEGEAQAVQALLDWAQTGPAAAKVSHVDTEQLPAAGDFTTFYIER
jgi:acylphosphatase